MRANVQGGTKVLEGTIVLRGTNIPMGANVLGGNNVRDLPRFLIPPHPPSKSTNLISQTYPNTIGNMTLVPWDISSPDISYPGH